MAEVAAARSAWQPESSAWELLETLRRDAKDRWILAKIWDPIRVALDEDEGPHYLRGLCLEASARPDDTGITQAYLSLKDISLVTVSSGYDGRGRYLTPSADGETRRLNLGDLHELQLLPE